MGHKRATKKCDDCGVGVVELALRNGTSVNCNTRNVMIVDNDGGLVEGYVLHSSTCPAMRKGKPVRPRGAGEDASDEEAAEMFRAIRNRLDGREPEGDF